MLVFVVDVWPLTLPEALATSEEASSESAAFMLAFIVTVVLEPLPAVLTLDGFFRVATTLPFGSMAMLYSLVTSIPFS